jgi:hypothetical protein
MKSIQAYAVPLAGAAIGGVIGYFLFAWLLSSGFYAMVLPGALIGFGASVGKNKSIAIAVVCGVAALALCVWMEWHFFPFNADDSFGYFVAHIHKLSPVTLLMMVAGTAMGFWFALPRGGRRAASF